MELFDVYPLIDLEPVRGEGSCIYSGDGTRYLDFYGGHAVISVGHSHPHYVERISRQLENIGFYSNSVQNPLQKELAHKLGELSGCEEYRLFLCNSGAEAVENALKMASFQNGKSRIISFKKGFHGRTSAAVSVTDNPRYAAPVNSNHEVTFLELNDYDGLEREISNDDVSAVIIECIQGIGGIRIPDDTFLQRISELCSNNDIIFICDEIQAGYGRTGKFFAWQHTGVRPDIITVAKGMGNGFPIAGTLFSPIFEAEHGLLGSTFGGNHLACAAGLAVLEIIENERLVDHAAKTGSRLIKNLAGLPEVREVRGRGLMIGMEFPFPVKKLREMLIREEQIVTGVSSNPNVLRLLPPLTVTWQQIDIFIQSMHNVLQKQPTP